MQKVSRQVCREFLWLAVSLGVTTLLASALFGWPFVKGDNDLHLHDTYFVISRWIILIPFFLFVTFLIYFIKELRKSFSRIFSNYLLVITGLALIVLLTILIQSFAQFTLGGWTPYPPLSALEVENNIPEITEDTTTKFITGFLTIVQAVVLIMLTYFVYP